jgi:hypothetical protein
VVKLLREVTGDVAANVDAVLELDGDKLGSEELSGVVTVEVSSGGEIGTAVERADVDDNFDEFRAFGQAKSTDISFRPSPSRMLITPKSCKQQHWRAATGRWPPEDSTDGVIQDAERRRSITKSNVTPQEVARSHGEVRGY